MRLTSSRIIFGLYLILVIIGPFAAKAAGSDHKLTVGEAINAMNALNSLDVHSTGVVDKGGNQVMAPNNFIFSGPTHLTMARDIAQGTVALKAYQEAVNALRTRMASGVPRDKLTPDGVPADKDAEFKKQVQETFDAPTDVAMIRLKQSDLCLDAAPPACPEKNNIPVSILTMLLPIIDQ
jgi:hypothetical protein